MCVIEISPVVETRRLVLREPRLQDAPRLAALANDFDVARMTLRMPFPYALADAEAFIASIQGQDPRRGATFLIEHEDLGPVGVIGLFEDADPAPEAGYWIGRSGIRHRGAGGGPGLGRASLEAPRPGGRPFHRQSSLGPGAGKGGISLYGRDSPVFQPGPQRPDRYPADGVAGLEVDPGSA